MSVKKHKATRNLPVLEAREATRTNLAGLQQLSKLILVHLDDSLDCILTNPSVNKDGESVRLCERKKYSAWRGEKILTSQARIGSPASEGSSCKNRQGQSRVALVPGYLGQLAASWHGWPDSAEV